MSLAGRRVLVTGADGFIGSHLVERLVADGATVRAFCLYNSFGSLGWLEDTDPAVRDAVDVRLGDIRDAEFVTAASEGIDIVMHLAALIAIPYSYQAARSFVETNVVGTLNVLEAARRTGARVIHTSTSEVYGTPESVPITETHPLNAQSPYAASKVAADQMVGAYQRSFDVPTTVLRPFNTYGPRQSARAVIPTIIEQLLAGEREVHLGRLDTRRDLTFVTDTVDGFVRAGQTDASIGTTVQLGTGREVSIGQLFELLRGIVGSDAVVVEAADRLRPDASEVLLLLSDPDKAGSLLGWQPSVSLEDGLRRTVDWFAARPRMDDVRRFRV